MVKSWLRKVLKKCIAKTRLHLIIKELIEETKILNSTKNVKGKNYVFYPETNIINLQNNNNAITIQEGSHIRGELLVWPYGGKIAIGNNVYLGENSKVWSGSFDGIIIEDDVLIAHNVTIIDSDSHEIDHVERSESYKKMIKNGHPTENTGVEVSPIRIKKHAWISYNCCILKGVTIGEGAIIGAGSIVTKNIPDYVLAAGNPAVVKKKLR